MATSYIFDNELVKIPGTRSRIKSGVQNPAPIFPYGNLLFIDTGVFPACTGGAGIAGELANNKDAVYEITSRQEWESFVKYGMPWRLGKPLFNPSKNPAFRGVSRIFYASARSSTCASVTITLTGNNNGSTSVVNGGVFVIKAKDEGIVGNGVGSASALTKGFGFKMTRGRISASHYVLTFYVGTYKGVDSNGFALDNIGAAETVPTVIARSIEFRDASQLRTWFQENAEFKEYFHLHSATVNGNGDVDDADLFDYANFTLFSGGTESYAGTTHLDNLIEATKDLNVNFVMTDIQLLNVSVMSATIETLRDAVNTRYKRKPELYITAGNTRDHFTASKDLAADVDSENCTVVHGGSLINTQRGTRTYSALYTAAALLGREAGLAPQIPVTFKDIDVDGLSHNMTEKEQEQSLDAGLLVAISQDGGFECLKGVNTLQKNTYLQNEDGTTHSKQLRRIARQLNMIIAIQARVDLLKDPNGPNRFTLSLDIVETWLEGFLKQQRAIPGIDNLIISFKEIKATRVADKIETNYKFAPNSEISFLFFTGTTLDI